MTAADKAKLLALVVAWRLRSTDLAAKYLDGYPRGLADAYKVLSDELDALVEQIEQGDMFHATL